MSRATKEEWQQLIDMAEETVGAPTKWRALGELRPTGAVIVGRHCIAAETNDGPSPYYVAVAWWEANLADPRRSRWVTHSAKGSHDELYFTPTHYRPLDDEPPATPDIIAAARRALETM